MAWKAVLCSLKSKMFNTWKVVLVLERWNNCNLEGVVILLISNQFIFSLDKVDRNKCRYISFLLYCLLLSLGFIFLLLVYMEYILMCLVLLLLLLAIEKKYIAFTCPYVLIKFLICKAQNISVGDNHIVFNLSHRYWLYF